MYINFILNNVVKKRGGSPTILYYNDKFDSSGCEMYFHFIKLENDSDLFGGRFIYILFYYGCQFD